MSSPPLIPLYWVDYANSFNSFMDIFLANLQTKLSYLYLDKVANIILKGKECVQQFTGHDPSASFGISNQLQELKYSLQKFIIHYLGNKL